MYLFPRIDDQFNHLKGEAIFSKIELRSRYHQLHIKEDEIYKINFQTRYGHYEFVVVPLGLTNSLATFICLMNNLLNPYMDKFFIMFIDDILVYSKNEEQHAENLAAVLRLLSKHRLNAKLDKCSFFLIDVHYLGHVLSKEGIAVDPKKKRAIMECVAPKNVDEVRSFMGLVSYYRRFIEKF